MAGELEVLHQLSTDGKRVCRNSEVFQCLFIDLAVFIVTVVYELYSDKRLSFVCMGRQQPTLKLTLFRIVFHYYTSLILKPCCTKTGKFFLILWVFCLRSNHFVEPLQPLLQEQFDPKTFAAHIVQCQMVGEVLYKLTSGIAELDRELYTQAGALYTCTVCVVGVRVTWLKLSRCLVPASSSHWCWLDYVHYVLDDEWLLVADW